MWKIRLRAALKLVCVDSYRCHICVVAKSTSWDLARSPGTQQHLGKKTTKRQTSSNQHPRLLPLPSKGESITADVLLQVICRKNSDFIFFRDDKEHSVTHHRSVHVPESPLLTVQDLPLYFVPLLVHSREGDKSRGALAELRPAGSACRLQTETYFACASACIKINSHFLAKARCSLAKLSCKQTSAKVREGVFTSVRVQKRAADGKGKECTQSQLLAVRLQEKPLLQSL